MGSINLDDVEVRRPNRRERRLLGPQTEAYRAYRKATRFHRRVWGGTIARQECDTLFRSAQARFERDARVIREAVILGARTVPDIATRVGLTQARVFRIVVLEDIKAVAR